MLGGRDVAVGGERRRRPWAVLLCLMWAAAASAQAPQESPTTEQEGGKDAAAVPTPPRFAEEIRVVAAPILEGERVTPFGTQVTTVNSRQIEDLGAGDLAAALRRLPGVTISRYNLVGAYGGGDGGAVYVRGLGSGRPGAEISTLVDGIPRFVGVWTHPLLDTLSTDAVAGLEVFKSAQPVLLGNMAFAGINLVPKCATREGGTTRLVGAFGTYSTSTGLLEHGARFGAVDYFLQASQRRSTGHRPEADGSVRSFYGRLGYAFAKGWDASVQVHGADAWADDPGRLGGPPRGQVPRFGVKDTLSIATVRRQHGNHEGSVKLYHHDGDIDWRQWDEGRQHAFTTLTAFESSGVRAREHLRLENRTEVVVGFDHDRYGGSTSERRPTTTLTFARRLLRSTAVYAMAARSFGSTVEITPSLGVRFTDTADFGGVWGGQAGVVLRRDNTELHANWAHAVNLPGLYAAVLFERWARGESWRELDPEVLRHAEVGVGQRIGEGARVQLVVFSDRVRNALRFVPPPPPPPAFANLGAYTVRGAEVSVTVQPIEKAALFGGVTYLDPAPADVPNAPQWALVAGASWAPWAGARLNLDAQWVDSQAVLNPRYAASQMRIAGYALINLKASHRLGGGGAMPVEVFVTAENLLDAEYEYRPGYPAPGRVVAGGLEVRF